MQRAAEIWGVSLTSGVTIRIGAQFNAMGGSPVSAILGSCGPTTVHRDFTGAQRASTWYVSALASSLAGTDVNGATYDDMTGQFNSDVDNGTVLGAMDWYYGYDGNAGSDIDFIKVVLHEIGHGIGFLSLVDGSSGAKFYGYDDVFMVYLENHATGKSYPVMTNAERLAASTSTGNLHWTGPNVVAYSGNYTSGVHATGHVRMYAPSPFEPGSSVSHFDTALSPNELMEPYFMADGSGSDTGWVPAATACSGSPCTVAQTPALAAGNYSWRVRAKNVTGTGPDSPWMSFSVQ